MVVASCPPGTIAFSGGVSTNANFLQGSGEIAVVYNMPTGNPPAEWVVMAQEMTATDKNWSVYAYAYCADIPGYKRAAAGAAFNSDNFKSIDVSCPGGTSMIGGGSSIIATPSQVVTLTESRPLGNGWAAGASEFTPTDGSWLLGVMASCAPTLDLDLEVISVHLRTTQDQSQMVDLYCAPHRTAIGGGWKFFGSSADQGLNSSHASQSFSEAWTAISRALTPGTELILSAYALCLSSEIFSDGFESGNTSAWSNTVP